MWQAARRAALSPEQVAGWAGHSVHVLLRVYAKCLDGEQEAARRRIDAALTDPGDDHVDGASDQDEVTDSDENEG